MHPFDPPEIDAAGFCADDNTLRGLELDMSDEPFADHIQVGYRQDTGGLNIYESVAGGSMGSTTLLAGLLRAGDKITVAQSPYRAAFSVERGETCEESGVALTVQVEEP